MAHCAEGTLSVVQNEKWHISQNVQKHQGINDDISGEDIDENVKVNKLPIYFFTYLTDLIL